MKAGVSSSDITPKIGTESAGSYTKRFITKIDYPLFAVAAVFESNGKAAALVGVDCCFLDASTVKKINKLVGEKCPIPAENIIIGASHTHSGGVVCGMADDLPDGTPDLIKQLALIDSPCPDPAYLEYFIHQTAQAIVDAWENRQEVQLGVGQGHEDSFVFNRRFRMKYGRTVTHPGRLNPNTVEPAGPVDPEVGVLAIWRENDSLLGCVVNYACHGTCGGSGGAHPDWIHFLRETIAKHHPGAQTVFLNGACGDVTQINNQSRKLDTGEVASKRLGTAVGSAVIKVLADMEKSNCEQICSKHKTMTIARRKPSPDKLTEALEIVRNSDSKPGTEWVFAKERVIYDYLYKQSTTVEVPMSLLQIGPALFAANPAEFFCELGLRIKNGINFKPAWVVSLANGNVGYVPTPESFAPDGGGYETALTSYSNLDITAGDLIVEKTVKMAEDFISASAPAAEATAKSFPTEWEYGLRGPDID